MGGAVALVMALSWVAVAHAQDQSHRHEHHAIEASPSSEAPITVTINPEARVSVSRAGELPPAVACGAAVELPVKIVNRGFVAAPLHASLIDLVPEGVQLEFSAEPLKGIVEEHRVLRVTLTKAEPVDITIAFRIKNNIADLGDRDRIHLLARCL